MKDVIEQLARENASREQAIEVLVNAKAALSDAIRLLDNSPKKKTRSSSGPGVSTEDVRGAVDALRDAQTSLSRSELETAVKERLKSEGHTLTGVDLGLNQVLGKNGTGA